MTAWAKRFRRFLQATDRPFSPTYCPDTNADAGYALPVVIACGFVMLTLGTATILMAQGDRNTAYSRKQSAASVLVSDSAIARALVELSQPQNGDLLVRNYDPINPKTGKTYLGKDGIPNSGDETATVIDEWTGYDPSSQPCYQQLGWSAPDLNLIGSIGNQDSYEIKAYRYDPALGLGTILVAGNYQGEISYVVMSVSVSPDLSDFPGIAAIKPDPTTLGGVVGLRGRQVIGQNANVYTIPENSADPALTGRSAPGEITRPSYLNSIWSSSADGVTGDPIEGDIVACNLNINIPLGLTGTDLGTITTPQTLRGVGGTVPTLYKVTQIDLSATDTLTIDTTGGPVFIQVNNSSNNPAIILNQQAKILNVRSDGLPPQVGDVRFLIYGNHPVNLYGQSCIQDVFLYSKHDELRLFTSNAGCSGGKNTNFEGVVWAEGVFGSKNTSSDRNLTYLGYSGWVHDTTIVTNTHSGIAVPDDVSSLGDLLQYIDWPVRYKYGAVQNWRQVELD